MENLGKIAGFNIAFIFAYAILLRLVSQAMGVVLVSMMLVIMQTLYNFVMAIVCYSNRQTPKANSYLLTTFLVLIIGFGACVLNFK